MDRVSSMGGVFIEHMEHWDYTTQEALQLPCSFATPRDHSVSFLVCQRRCTQTGAMEVWKSPLSPSLLRLCLTEFCLGDHGQILGIKVQKNLKFLSRMVVFLQGLCHHRRATPCFDFWGVLTNFSTSGKKYINVMLLFGFLIGKLVLFQVFLFRLGHHTAVIVSQSFKYNPNIRNDHSFKGFGNSLKISYWQWKSHWLELKICFFQLE